jgi:hypothetical protein
VRVLGLTVKIAATNLTRNITAVTRPPSRNVLEFTTKRITVASTLVITKGLEQDVSEMKLPRTLGLVAARYAPQKDRPYTLIITMKPEHLGVGYVVGAIEC